MSIPNFEQKPSFGGNQGIWEYYSYDGDFIGYIVRKPPKEEGQRKYFVPWTFQNNEWVMRWWENNKAPFYNAQLLKQYPDKPVMIVEGEKTADAASVLFPEFICITWKGGAQGIKNAPVALLQGRQICLWPDNDINGIDSMNELQNLLAGIASKVVKINPDTYFLPLKWDLADFNEQKDTLDLELVRLYIQESWKCIHEIQLIPKERFPILSANNKILNTYENIRFMLEFYKVRVRYNDIKKEIEVDIPHKNFTRANKAKLILAELSSLCIKNNIPRTELADWILMIADQNNYNPLYDFLNQEPWDGCSRIPDFLNTITCKNTVLRDMLVNKWMIGAIATGLSKDGLAHQGVLTLCGPQFCGKSSWFSSLMPDNPRLILGDHSLAPSEKDSIRTATRFWLTELSEVDGAVRKSDVASMKSFLTRKLDVYRCPYDRADTEAPRNTAFVATVNDKEFLRDNTGNRRWWVLDVEKLNAEHNINMQQLWAEYYAMLLSGQSLFLNESEFNTLTLSNLEHTVKPAIDEIISERYSWENPDRPLKRSATQVLIDCSIDLGGSDKTKLIKETHTALKKLTQKEPIMIRGYRFYYTPTLNPYFGR